MAEQNMTVAMPALALRGLTVFPNMLLHFDVGREASIKALDECMSSGRPIFLVAQRDMAVEQPALKDLYSVGTISSVKQILRLPGNNVRVMVEGSGRGRLLSLHHCVPYLLAEVEELPEPAFRSTPRTEALIRQAYELFEQYCELSPRVTPDLMLNVLSSQDPGYIADYITQNIAMRAGEKQAILEELRPVRRLERLCQALGRELEILAVEQQLHDKVRESIGENQRDYYLREQLKAIQSELGQGEGDELADYHRAIAQAKLPAEVAEKLEREVDRLRKQSGGSAEASVIRNYLDTCLELPWGKKTKERVSVEAARKILDADHFGLEKVKDRILEFLAVKQLSPELRGQVICLVGPPGVGKTSIAMSVARAVNRKFARVSLGGVRDEAEIRGHRKTYVGAMPGRIVNAIVQCGSMNPLMVLDEIDKLGSDYRGDPSAALLEVLDSAQNHAFRDHYLEIPLDLSDVMFVTTANTTDTIPRPLLDRMEVIELPSYTDEEKVQIAKRYLLPRQMKATGLKRSQLRITDAALRAVIDGYTRESGVRRLEREMGALCRKAAVRLVEDPALQLSVTPKNLQELLGPVKIHPEVRGAGKDAGVVTGLAWTAVGGELLEVEVNLMDGAGKLECTGNLGDVMKESIHIAVS